MIQPGMIIGGRFRVDRLLGAGGMGVVVAATHVELGQVVALKVLHDELARDPLIVARFLREARAVAQLRTEHVCRVFDVGRLDNGAPFIVMEMLEGSDLGSTVLRGPLPLMTAAEYVIQACVALAEAHAAGVVHRDLKPANLFVTRRADGGPLVKVLDFGIAKAATAAEARLTSTTSQMGSPGFMSPEQIKSARDVDLWTDIWALGVTLYQLVSGRMPFAGTQLAEIAVNIMTVAPAPLDIDPAARVVVMRCLEKEPERRFPDVQALATALLPFGGPSAPHFVRALTGGQLTVPGTSPLATGDVPPTAPPTGVAATPRGAPPTGLAVATPGVVAHGPTVATAAPAPDTIPTPVATSSRGRRWTLIVVAAIVLIGVGSLVGWLARGKRAEVATVRVVDAGGPAEPDARGHVAEIAVDASAVVVAPVDAIDVWAIPVGEEAADPPVPEPETPAMDQEALKLAKAAAGVHAKEIRQGLRQAEKMLELYKRRAPEAYDQVVAGYTQTACMVDEVALAQRLFDRITDVEQRHTIQQMCGQFGVTLIDRTRPKASKQP